MGLLEHNPSEEPFSKDVNTDKNQYEEKVNVMDYEELKRHQIAENQR
jgi:hypothetical protein